MNATLSQTINGLTVGDGYLLTFYWATAELDDVHTAPTTEQLDVSLGSQSQATQTLSTMTQGFDPWREVTMYFSATSTSETLSFLAAGTPGGDPPTVLLDAVSLVYAREPSTWTILLAGFVGLVTFAAVKRRSGYGFGLAA